MKLFLLLLPCIFFSSCFDEFEHYVQQTESMSHFSTSDYSNYFHFCGQFLTKDSCQNESPTYGLKCSYYDNYCWEKSYVDSMNDWEKKRKKTCYDFKDSHSCKKDSKLAGLSCSWESGYHYCFEKPEVSSCFSLKTEKKCKNSKKHNLDCSYYKGKCTTREDAERSRKYDENLEQAYREYEARQRAQAEQAEAKRQAEFDQQSKKYQDEARRAQAEFKKQQEQARKQAEERQKEAQRAQNERNKFCKKIFDEYGQDKTGYKKMGLKLHPDRNCKDVITDQKKYEECLKPITEKFKAASACYGK